MRHLFLFHPNSFRKAGSFEQMQATIASCFPDEQAANLTTYISRYPRDVISFIHHYMEDIPTHETVRVYAVGDDEILFECLNGMVDFPNAELTNIPCGSTYDFIRTFGEDARSEFLDIQTLLTAPSQPVDIINCSLNYAISKVALGLESQAVIYANEILRKWTHPWLGDHSFISYLIGAVKAIFNKELRNQEYQILLDGEDFSGSYTNIAVSNGACAGGGLLLNPYALPNDGLLDVIFTEPLSALGTFNFMKDYVRGHFEKHSNICFHRRFKRMEVKSNIPIRVNIDHETFYTLELTIEIEPDRIHFVAPKGRGFWDYSPKAYQKKKDSTV